MFRGLVVAAVLAAALTLNAFAPVLAADPSSVATAGASPAPTPLLVDPLDPRAGAGASRIGAPLLAIVVVIGLGTLTVAATVVFVRVTRRA